MVFFVPWLREGNRSFIVARRTMAARPHKREFCQFNIWGFGPRRAAGITPTW